MLPESALGVVGRGTGEVSQGMAFQFPAHNVWYYTTIIILRDTTLHMQVV